MSACRKMQTDPYLSPYITLKIKWINDHNMNLVTLNLTEEKVGSSLEQTGIGNYFLNITPIAQTLRSTNNKWDLLKPKSFCKAKDTIRQNSRL